MRQSPRLPLPTKASHFLSRKQTEVNGGADATATWTKARTTKSIGDVYSVLATMAGRRARCMFCGDSRGTDIEHFYPKRRYPVKTFVWPNLLLACAGCNRQKGDRLELDDLGDPLLIDPTAEDPWDFLFFDSATGWITARYQPDGTTSSKGEYTCREEVLPLNVEAVTDGRCRTRRNLKRAVQHFVERAGQGAQLEVHADELAAAVHDNDDYGLAAWFFLRDGREEPPFSDLRKRYPSTWVRLEQAVNDATHATQPAIGSTQ